MKRILYLAFAALALASCSKQKDEPTNNDIPAEYYRLSPDGLTLVEWTHTGTTTLDMQADSKLQKITTIDKNAFRNSNIENITFPNTLKEIGDYAFYGASLSGTVTFNSSSRVTFGTGAFAGSQIQAVKLPDTREIPQEMFSNCMRLKEVTFGKVEKIGVSAFQNNALIQVNLDNTGLTEVGETAFVSCERLEKLVLPATLTRLQKRAFSGCLRLGNITVKAIEVPTMDDASAFNSGSIIRRNIYVPSSRVEAYKNARNWNYYVSEISGILEI